MKFVTILSLVLLPFLLCGCDSKTAATDNPPTASTETATMPTFPVTHTDAEWKKILTPEQYDVLREKGTEAPFTGKYDNFYEPGTYSCAACGQVLFTSDTKFNAGCGWPAFYAAKAGDRVILHHDTSFGMDRTEVLCARCGSHLGHIFNDADLTAANPEGTRYCINSVAIKFTPDAPAQAAPSDTKPTP